MATITVLKFDTPDGAEKMLEELKKMAKVQLIKIQDSAVVSWPAGAKAPKTKQMVSMTGMGALTGAFWGMLFGLIFFVPFFGMAIGAAMGALAGKFNDYGIDDEFIKTVREKVTEGTSALFLMTSDAVMDKVAPQMKATGLEFEVISTNLSNEQEAKLKEIFSAE